MRICIAVSVVATLTAVPIAAACARCGAGGNALHASLLPTGGELLGPQFLFSEAGGPLSVPVLSSRPSARAKLYLDFDGDFTSSWGTLSPGATPAYSLDNDPTTFTPTELSYIDEIWQGVSEKFSPFDVDVTTINPGPLIDFESYRIVIGGTGSWFGLAGGVAYLGGFTGVDPNTAYVFSGNLLPADPLHASFVTAATAHEAGHGFGLLHQSHWNGTTYVSEYNRGDDEKAPIMGSSYRKRGLWWQGPTVLSTLIQNDVNHLGDEEINGFGFRADDHGNTPATASALAFVDGEWAAEGVITRRTDVDYFSLDFSGGLLAVVLSVAPYEAMLDAALSLYNLSGDLIVDRDTASLGESFTLSLPEGEYFIAVRSHGLVGDIGQYRLSASVAIPEPASMAVFLAVTGTAACRRRGQSGARFRSKSCPII
ncbi:MAG TPA: hypothetical protein PLD59_06765 [Tepidisphaeraceae bacterium]|nr:hypothetical protein [Tepidisphaeraceae bacterium]